MVSKTCPKCGAVILQTAEFYAVFYEDTEERGGYTLIDVETFGCGAVTYRQSFYNPGLQQVEEKHYPCGGTSSLKKEE